MDRLVTLSNEERFPILGEGLEKLGDRVAHLAGAVAALKAADDVIAAAALDVICTEEAAKVLILLDLARCMHPQKPFAKGCKYFYSHLARGIYAHVHEGNPADFAEIMRYVEVLRPSHYLDGPNDADWIFRNEILRGRESALYVDYEESQREEFSWTGGEREMLYVPARLTRLILALRTSGVLTEAGARAAAKAWKNAPFDGSTRWEFARERAKYVLAEIAVQENKDPTQEMHTAWRTVMEKWTFPLIHLDLTLDGISIEEMSEQQAHHYNRMMMDEYGAYDY
ncbi:hypothetical protein [Pseudarthrobacter sp. SSS035]|uniref:hypothetical protein n=1 Tax=Pseudarthrobacter sp. SSS035 TaxID=2931399 RepID=UPI00200F5AEE|nr:hypothetical protein [Pseudarthrobacter sp. SSS035]